MNRTAKITRNTYETKISVSIDLDAKAKAAINTGIGFLDHMIEQIARHAQIELHVQCDGDTYIDDHHSTEDIGIAIGQAVLAAVGDKKGIVRYGHAYCPLDEALTRVVIDLSGRPGLYFFGKFPTEKIGTFDTELVQEFFQGFTNHAMATVHIDNIRGTNSHHIAETMFKAFARALRIAIGTDEKSADVIPSTKGVL
ncbi:MAG: imidazoleglycerol-phosphate dehydratase [Gammaproteobacteria bacterium]|nr:MAG: imidazoleglycerol-phosphate dehydratase [Gammaproteobacteria bacterium]